MRSGRALYAGISSYSASWTAEAARVARDLGTPLLIHQPSYSMLNRWIEPELLDTLEEEGMGCIVFTPLAQGLLTDRYLDGIPEDSRAAREGSTIAGLDDEVLDRVRSLNAIALRRDQKLAQLALQWALRDPRVTSAVIGASSVEQLDTNLDALDFPPLTEDELAEIDKHAVDSGVNLWAAKSAPRSQQNRSDARLFGVSALLHGEATMTSEFDEWVAARGPGLLRLAYVLTGNRADAEDAVQDALARALPRWEHIRTVGDPDAYVRRMVVNAHTSWWRRFRKRETPVAEAFPRGVDRRPGHRRAGPRVARLPRTSRGPARGRGAALLRTARVRRDRGPDRCRGRQCALAGLPRDRGLADHAR